VALPVNVPADSPDLRWVSMAGSVLATRLILAAPDLEPVPLWESMPVALEAVGGGQSITAQMAAYIASRTTARWAVQGDLLPDKRGMKLRLDFIPARASDVAFRYEGAFSPNELARDTREAFEEFLRYLIARPFPKKDNPGEWDGLSEIAEALELEYGWNESAQPGKAQQVVAALVSSHKELVRILFNPAVYPAILPPASGTAGPAAPPAGE
jgi:hypothetical protein